ncbi:MAG TPA: hydrophobe/amphiphile efflux-1 family RND transporter [Porticoccaceae bacterium]|nr:hydrophobe/amphiphile efflux-1 family RND transporter [Porticoccaceae bacterium]
MSDYFIDRPIFAWVIAIVLMIVGAISITRLPIEQYPEVAPPAVEINTINPGASAQTVDKTVTQIIEQSMTGIDNLLYMSSTSDSSGRGLVKLTFFPGTDPDIAQVQVQNKLQAAMQRLPQAVRDQGVTVNKAATGVMMVVALSSPDGRYDRYDLGDYMAANIVEPVGRITGVGEASLFGAQYAMRIWLDADKLNSYQITPAEVNAAIRSENAQIPAGELGAGPAVPGQELNATIIAQTLLETPEEFGDILLKVESDGSHVYLRDVARIEIGGEDYQFLNHFHGRPAAGMAVRQASGANALETSNAVKEKLAELARYLPEGMELELAYDTTPFVEVSILEVIKTLFEAIALVFIVMFLFLQNLRATLIPTIAIPVILLGTFGVLQALGFSINTLSMFGMVLAIGLLVDDAIVVVENTERLMDEEHLSARDATRKSMRQITGALIGIGVVLSAVFIPMAFFPGSSGAIYRQFSVTIATAMILSVLVALILTPALCASMLGSLNPEKLHKKSGFFGWFNRGFDSAAGWYQARVGKMLQKILRYFALYAAIIIAIAWLFERMPTSFIPSEDPGLMFALVQTPVGATMERSREVMEQVEEYFREEQADTVATVYCVVGSNFMGRGQNAGQCYIKMHDWSDRPLDSQHVTAVSRQSTIDLARIKDALIFVIYPPPIRGLGNAAGVALMLKDIGGQGHAALLAARNQVLAAAAKDPRLIKARPNGQEDRPQFKVEIDRHKARALGLSLDEINSTLTTAWASTYVNDFIHNDRVKKVYVQGEKDFRMLPQDIDHWYVRNRDGDMVPFSAFAHGYWVKGSPRLERYNATPSMEIVAEAAPGHSSGDAIAAFEEIMADLPPGFGYEWTGASLQETTSGALAPLLYTISLLFVFLCLAALYESWSIPFVVMLVVPLGVIGALLAAYGRGLANDIYFQVAVLTTIGVATKNAILIVEFAKDLQNQGRDLIDATLEAVRLRLRPILMTSFAFMIGVLPLALATGAGSQGQNAIGTGVLGGMFTSTLLAIFMVPLFFVVVRRRFPGRRPGTTSEVPPSASRESAAPPSG